MIHLHLYLMCDVCIQKCISKFLRTFLNFFWVFLPLSLSLLRQRVLGLFKESLVRMCCLHGLKIRFNPLWLISDCLAKMVLIACCSLSMNCWLINLFVLAAKFIRSIQNLSSVIVNSCITIIFTIWFHGVGGSLECACDVQMFPSEFEFALIFCFDWVRLNVPSMFCIVLRYFNLFRVV